MEWQTWRTTELGVRKKIKTSFHSVDLASPYLPTENFLKKAKDVEPIALICEGTRMAVKETRQNYSEPQVKQLSDKIVASTDKAVFTIHASRDIDRFNSFFEVANKNNRKINSNLD